MTATTNAAASDVLGTGWRFPPVVSNLGHFDLRSGPVLVRQSILVILGTEPGERLMRPEFGCGLRQFLMEPNNPTTRAAIAANVQTAIAEWEPRVRLDPVDVLTTDDPGAVLVSISYTLVRDHSLDALQMVVPVGGVDRTGAR